MKRTLAFALVLVCAACEDLEASPHPVPSVSALAGVPVPELPPKAVSLVKAAEEGERTNVTVAVVKSAALRSPAVTPAVVGGIAKAVPQMASVAARAGAEVQPKRACECARAAAMAAPAQAADIVSAVSQAVPKQYRKVALAVAQAVPGSDEEIIKALAFVFPELKGNIETVRARHPGATHSVAAVLDSVTTAPGDNPLPTRVTGGPIAMGPSVGPPFIPLSGTVTNVTPVTSDPVPEGGRDYAAP